MNQNTAKQNIRKDQIAAIVTTLPIVYWGLVFWIIKDVYKYAVVGAIFEFLWFPMLLALFTIPIISAILWAKEKWSFRTLYPLCIALCLAYIILGLFGN